MTGVLVDRVSARRVGFAVLGGLAAVSVLAWTVARIDDSGLTWLYGLGGFEWALPVVVGVSVGVVAWLVLAALPVEQFDALVHAEQACPACGKSILDDWRLCPHCGTLVDEPHDDSDGGIP